MSQSQFYNKPVTGSITTQNLNIATTATANSAVVISVDPSTQTIGMQVSGTYTSGAAGTLFGLQVQATIDGTNWFNVEKFAQIATNNSGNVNTPPKLWKSNIPNANQGIYAIKNEGYTKVRVCCISGAVTGTATVTLNNSNTIFPTDIVYARYKTVTSTTIPITTTIAGLGALRGSNTVFTRLLKMELYGDHGAFYSTQLGVGRLDYNRVSTYTVGTSVSMNTTRKSDPNLPGNTAAPFASSTAASQTITETITRAGFSQRHTTVNGNYSPTFISYGWDTTNPIYILRSAAEFITMDHTVGTSFGGSAVQYLTIEWEEY